MLKFLLLFSFVFAVIDAGKLWQFVHQAQPYSGEEKRIAENAVYREKSNMKMVVQCAFECQKDALCKSYNFIKASGLCQMSDRVAEKDDLIDDTQSQYYHRDTYLLDKSALGLCSTNNPCKNGRCLDRINDDGEKDFECVCAPHWEGPKCDINKGKPYWGPWGDWSDCSATCGPGYKTMIRQCLDPQSKTFIDDNRCYGAHQTIIECNISECPRWSDWTVWTECSSNRTCSKGVTSRERLCMFGGVVNKDPGCTGGAKDEVFCFSPECGGGVYLANDDDTAEGYGEGRVMVYNDKTDSWGQVCNAGWDRKDADVVCHQVGLAGVHEVVTDSSFGAGTEKYFMFDLECTANEKSIQACRHGGWVSAQTCTELGGTGPAAVRCAVHGDWSGWSDWGQCSVTCAEGTQERTRKCDNPPAMRQGRPCPGESMEQRPCVKGPCPVDGTWAEWSEWEQCSHVCGGGKKLRSRVCNDPLHGGKVCVGYDKEEADCNTHNCPVDGVWDTWGKWQECSKTCGSGTQSRERSCVGPQHGGKPCSAEDGKMELDTRTCNTDPCPAVGVYGVWGAWGACSATCEGVHTRTRPCTPAGAICHGPSEQTEPCTRIACQPLRNCHEYYSRGLTAETSVRLDPDGISGPLEPFNVECDFSGHAGITVIHHDLVNRTLINDYEEACSYSHVFKYDGASVAQLIALVDSSAECRQYTKYECNAAAFINKMQRVTYVVDRKGDMMEYWGGAPRGSGKCGCGVSGTCIGADYSCNCDYNADTLLTDDGYLQYKEDLPVTKFCAGDTGSGLETSWITIGPLICSGLAGN